MNSFRFYILFLCISICSLLFAQVTPDDIPELPDHPRILLLNGEENKLKEIVEFRPFWQKFNNKLINRTKEITQLPELIYNKTGKRLLSVSREALYRIFMCSYSYRMTGEELFLRKAEKEMLAVCGFDDWNPSHFLDVAEMATGVAIGYDWLYDQLEEDAHIIIREALLNKAIKTSLLPENSYWLKKKNNWNQVCNTGMLFAALAIGETEDVLAKEIIARSIESIKYEMESYAPDGVYPEGYGYWHYGTTFNVVMIDALQKAFGTDFGLSEAPGFMKTASYIQQMLGPHRLTFNYSDSDKKARMNTAVFWFADQLNDPSLIWHEMNQIKTQDVISDVDVDRFAPMILIWGSRFQPEDVRVPERKLFSGKNSVNPVFMMRSSWEDKNAIYIGLKAGSPSASHAHMDSGSFILDANGVRWALDLGANDYNTLEQAGLRIWDSSQESDRWKVFRYNNFAHNTLTINNALQQVEGNAEIIAFGEEEEFMYVVTELSEIYSEQVQKVVRGIALVDLSYIIVQDEITNDSVPSVVRWQMVTKSTPRIINDRLIELTTGKEKLSLSLSCDQETKAGIWSGESDQLYDDSNPGVKIVGFEINLSAYDESVIKVELLPKGVEVKTELNWIFK